MAYDPTVLQADIAEASSKLFATTVAQFSQVQALANKSAAQLSNMTDNVFLQMTQLYQATAAQLIQVSKLASDILQARSAGGQPQASAADAGVSGGGGPPAK